MYRNNSIYTVLWYLRCYYYNNRSQHTCQQKKKEKELHVFEIYFIIYEMFVLV